MSLDTAGESPAEDSGSASSEATATATTSQDTKTGYSVVDPGYETVEPADDELAALKAENTKKPPATVGDASEADGDSEGDAEETAEAPAVDGAEAQAAEPFEVSDELLDRAIAVGYELDDIRDFKDATAFERELGRVERLQQRLQGRKADPTSATEIDPPPEDVKEPDWDQLIQDGHDPDIVALQKSSWQRAASAEAMVRQLQQTEQQRAVLAQSERFDEAINSLGEEYEPILGKGRRSALPKAVAENRQKVFTKMAILEHGYKLSGQPVPPEAELIQEAVHASFYKQTQEFARNAFKRQIKNAGSQALSRPRSGSAKDLPGPERALAKEQEFWKSHS